MGVLGERRPDLAHHRAWIVSDFMLENLRVRIASFGEDLVPETVVAGPLLVPITVERDRLCQDWERPPGDGRR